MPANKDHNCPDDNELAADIEKYGWIVLGIEKSDYLPGFVYTVGLWKKYKHPEIISFGLSTATLQSILNIAGELVKSGEKLTNGKTYDDFFEEGSAQFLKVDKRNISDYFGYAMWFNEYEDFPALQLVWTDRNNRFPWDEDFEKEFERRQPLLDRNADFKFMEPENLAVLTTRQWIELKKPILRVVHNHDGDWQFLTGDQILLDARVVALKGMVIGDGTLNEIFNLEYGEAAVRMEIGGKWERNEIEPEDN